MSVFVTRGRRKKADGEYHLYYELRENRWVETDQGRAMLQRYVGYLGKRPEITTEKAEAILAREGNEHLSLADLQTVKGLAIVEDE